MKKNLRAHGWQIKPFIAPVKLLPMADVEQEEAWVMEEEEEWVVEETGEEEVNGIKLLQAGWVYDINFKPTLYIIRERRYLEMIREALPESPEINEIFDSIYYSLNSFTFTKNVK